MLLKKYNIIFESCRKLVERDKNISKVIAYMIIVESCCVLFLFIYQPQINAQISQKSTANKPLNFFKGRKKLEWNLLEVSISSLQFFVFKVF